MFKTTANKITMLRIILIPVFLVLAYMGSMIPALIVYVVACLTDFVDGYIARHYNQISNFGKFMDPLADKMLVLAAMCFFIENGQMAGWAVAVVLFREFAVSGMRLLAVEQGKVIAAGMSGKVKTFATMICLIVMLVVNIDIVNIISTVIIVGTTVYSGAEYFYVNREVFKEAN